MAVFDPLKKWLRYKWEFLRRDPEYKKAYKEVLPHRTGHKPTLIETHSDSTFLKCEAPKFSKEEIDYCHYFEFGPPLLDPDLSFDEMINKYYGWCNPVKELTDTEENLFLSKIAGITNNHLIIGIDFTKVNSPDALNKIVLNLIKARWLQYIEHSEDKTIKIHESLNTTLFIGDLKINNPNMSWPEIASQAFPGEPKSDSLRVKACQHYARYQKLINGGWRGFKFP